MRLTEDLVIARAAQLVQGDAVMGIGDDAAVVRPPGGLQLLATDMLVEGTHFTRQTHSAYDLGWKALAVNVSDVAAMGGTPDFCLLSLGIPKELDLAWADQFFDGLAACAKEASCQLIGGDTVRSPVIVINLAITGHSDHPLRRHGAKPGDAIVVVGELGASAAGLWLLQHPEAEAFGQLIRAHQRPPIRVREGQQLALFAHAGCDTSDGLARSCQLLAEAGPVTVVIETSRLVPPPGLIETAQKAGVDPVQWMVTGGEDFALMAAIAPLDQNRALALGARVVGYCESGTPDVWLEDPTGRHALPTDWGYRHF